MIRLNCASNVTVRGTRPVSGHFLTLKVAVHYVRAKIAPNRLIAEFNISGYGVCAADSARPQRVSGSARIHS